MKILSWYYVLLYAADSDSDEALVATQQNSFRPTVDLKRFEQFVTEEENKPELPYTSTASDRPKPSTSHPLRNTKKIHTTATNGSTAAVSSQPKDKPMESVVDTSLPTVTDMSTIDIDTAAGANDGDTVDSGMSNDIGSAVQASLKFEGQQHQRQGGGGVQHNDALKSVLNPSPQQRQQQHMENTKVNTVCIIVIKSSGTLINIKHWVFTL